MSTVVEVDERQKAPQSAAPAPRRAGRAAIVAVLILALVGSGATRFWADSVRGEPIVASNVNGRSLSGMNSYALALLLGGLRGPLVMFLWSSSENQKTENNLEDFDSKVEWIRLLQPEFDTVHIFQIWNKAYNISVKMTNLANKYSTILDALDYAHNVDAEKPNDINIISAIGGIYFDKFGNSAEKLYYRKRVRNETLPHATDAAIRRNDPGVRRTQLDPMLDKNFNVLPELLTPRMSQPLVDPDDPKVVYDGSELQFLKEYNPYPYGISPFALAYNYDRRAQLLQLAGKQRHAQLSDLVIDSRPALALRGWADEEAEYGRRAELKGFGQPVPENADKLDFETNAAGATFSQPVVNRDAINEAIFEYDRAATIYARADKEFADHINRFKTNEQNYQSHRAEVQAMQALLAADRDYLKAMVATGDERAALVKQAIEEYTRAANLQRVVILKYRVYEQFAEQVYPQGVTRANVNENTPNLADITNRAVATMEEKVGKQNFLEDSNDTIEYINRAETRLKLLEAAK
jgi:hypothetical protein